MPAAGLDKSNKATGAFRSAVATSFVTLLPGVIVPFVTFRSFGARLEVSILARVLRVNFVFFSKSISAGEIIFDKRCSIALCVQHQHFDDGDDHLCPPSMVSLVQYRCHVSSKLFRIRGGLLPFDPMLALSVCPFFSLFFPL